MSAIEEAQIAALRDYEDNYVQRLESDWEESKRGLLEALGVSQQAMMGGDVLADDVTGMRTPSRTPLRPGSLFPVAPCRLSSICYLLFDLFSGSAATPSTPFPPSTPMRSAFDSMEVVSSTSRPAAINLLQDRKVLLPFLVG